MQADPNGDELVLKLASNGSPAVIVSTDDDSFQETSHALLIRLISKKDFLDTQVAEFTLTVRIRERCSVTFE